MDVFARETNKSPRLAERSDRRDTSETGRTINLLEIVGISASDTVKCQSSNLEVYSRGHWQPVESVT